MSILTDARTKVEKFSQSVQSDSSWRIAQRDEKLLPPFYYLTFVDIFERQELISLKSLDNEFRLFHLGRPYWGAFLGDTEDL